MLAFAVFDVSPGTLPVPSAAWPLRHAYVFGQEDVPVPGDARSAPGLIRVEKRTPESAGLCLQFPLLHTTSGSDAAPALERDAPIESLVTLQTALLPERERPYLLSLELARHRLMLTLNKLEDWALFDLPPDDPGLSHFEAARRAFTEALVASAEGNESDEPSHRPTENGYSPYAEQLSRRALAMAVDASELITLRQSRAQHRKRMTGELAAAAARISTPASAITDHEAAESRAALIGSAGVILPSPPQIGVAVNPDLFTPSLCKAVQLAADFVTMPMRWLDMEPTEGKYLFGKTDKWIEWAVRNARLPIVGGPIIDFRRGAAPEWLYIWEHDYETLRELVYEHVKNLVTRYRRTVGTWTAVSGLHVASNFALSIEQVMDLTRLVVMVIRKLQPSCKVQVQIDQPWSEYSARSSRSIPALMYADMVMQAGVNPDLLALRVEMGQPEVGRSTRDPMALSAMLDRYAALERPLSVAAVGVPSRAPDAESLGIDREMDPGCWRAPWSPRSQVEWMTRTLAIAASKPYVHSVCWNELYDAARAPDNHGFGLIEPSGLPKPALWRLAEIRKAIREKRSPLELPPMPADGSLA